MTVPLSVCLALGAITSVLSAWIVGALSHSRGLIYYTAPLTGYHGGIAMDPNIRVGLSPSGGGRDTVYVSLVDTVMFNYLNQSGYHREIAEHDQQLPRSLPFGAFQREHGSQLIWGNSGLQLPYWARSIKYRFALPETHFASGVPFRCLRGKFGGITGDTGFIQLSHPRLASALALPIIPIWPGLIANSVLHGVAWTPLVLGIGYLSNYRRRRSVKGLCPSCAYDLQDTTACPECGHNMPATATPTPQ
jgi:hypothetical protein